MRQLLFRGFTLWVETRDYRLEFRSNLATILLTFTVVLLLLKACGG